MGIVTLRDGSQAVWEPTTELICSLCREPLDISTVHKNTMECVNLVSVACPDHHGLQRGVYFYLHKRCSRIDELFNELWLMWGMKEFLGLHSSYNKHFGDPRKAFRKEMPAGLYEQIYAVWLPARASSKAPFLHQPPRPREPRRLVKIQERTLALRFQILKRDHYRCRLCGISAKDGEHVRLEVDHITPRAKGGTDDPMNLWTLCFACNRGKGVQPL